MDTNNNQDVKANITKELSLDNIITNAVKIPGVRVDRSKFLSDCFSNNPDLIGNIIEEGPVAAGIDRDELTKIAKRLILRRTSESSIISFAAGIPGGLAMAATIPADVLQFFGMTLRLAQELSYLYGAEDLWGEDGEAMDEKVKGQLILYTGVMFGVTSAAAGVRVLSAQLAKTALKKLPQKALTKTFWYPIIKKIGSVLSVKITKSVVAKAASKMIPVIGGVISGGLNFASMFPMANRLQETLDKSCFDYSEEEFEADQNEIESVEIEAEELDEEEILHDEKETTEESDTPDNTETPDEESLGQEQSKDDIFSTLKKLKELQDMGIISQEEFDEKKKDLLEKL